MSASKVLKAEARPRVGKGAARALRREGKIPAVIYGDKKPALGITLDRNQLTRLLHAGGFMTTLFDIEVDGKKEHVLPRDYQVDPVRDFLVHIDFLRVGANSVITVDVPVHFVNDDKSPGIKRGGVLNIVAHHIECSVPASRIPEFIEVDLTGLEIADTVHISGLKLPEGVHPVTHDRDFTVATIAAPTVAIEETAEAAAPAESETPAD